MKIGCVVMAAGDARRFGENKLAAEFDGKSLICRALDAVPAQLLHQTIVVTQYPEVEALAKKYGFLPVRNPHPDWGISYTIRLGLEALNNCDAALFQVSDQPMLKRQSVENALALFLKHPQQIVALSHGGVRGNPCIFPARFFPELLALQEDHGGSSVIRQHENDLLLLEVPAQELEDADTRQALMEMQNRKKLV